MGCCGSKAGAKYEVAQDTQLSQGQQGQGYSWEKRKKKDPSEFMFTGLEGEVKVKEPGSVDGEGFIIDNCKNCDLYIFDRLGQITIDDCENCRIFVGPVAGSLFIRDCKNCKCVFICRQFRTRDCHDCDTLLLCRSRPIIESSTEMRFGCYDLPYRGFAAQMKESDMHRFHNFWGHIYDFTPNAERPNFTYLPETVTSLELLTAAGDVDCVAQAGEEDHPLITWGEREVKSKNFLWVVFPAASAEEALPFALEAGKHARILHTNGLSLTKEEAEDIAGKAGWGSKQVAQLSAGQSMAIEFSGSKGIEVVTPMAEACGALVTTNSRAAQVYRYMGVEC